MDFEVKYYYENKFSAFTKYISFTTKEVISAEQVDYLKEQIIKKIQEKHKTEKISALCIIKISDLPF